MQDSLPVPWQPKEVVPLGWAKVAKAVHNARAPGTRGVYASHWKSWLDWYHQNGAVPLPTTPDALARYLAEKAERHQTSWRTPIST